MRLWVAGDDLYVGREERSGVRSGRRSACIFYTALARHRWQQKGRERGRSRSIISPHDDHRLPVPPVRFSAGFPRLAPPLSFLSFRTPPHPSPPVSRGSERVFTPRQCGWESGRSIQSGLEFSQSKKFDWKVVTLLGHVQQYYRGDNQIGTLKTAGCALFLVAPQERKREIVLP